MRYCVAGSALSVPWPVAMVSQVRAMRACIAASQAGLPPGSAGLTLARTASATKWPAWLFQSHSWPHWVKLSTLTVLAAWHAEVSSASVMSVRLAELIAPFTLASLLSTSTFSANRAATRRCPALDRPLKAVLNSLSLLIVIVSFSFCQMIGDHLGQPHHRNVHLIVLQPFLQHDAAIGAGGDQSLRAGLFQLRLLDLESSETQFLRFFDGAHPAAAAAAPIHLAGVARFHEVRRHQIQKITRLFKHAAAPDELARIVEGEQRILEARGLEQPLATETVQHFQDVQHVKGVGAADEVGAFPAQRGVGMAAFRPDYGFDLELFRTIDDALDEHPGDVGNADLDAAVGGLEGFGAERPALAGLLHDFGDGAQVFGKVDDLHRGHQHHVFRA